MGRSDTMGNKEFYKFARAYDLAFSDRDFEQECQFLEWCFREHSSIPILPETPAYLEVACGPANHARVFARQGWQTAGLDLSDAMLAYAASKDRAAGVTTAYYSADMSDFTTGSLFHLASNPIESISHILTNDQMLSHLRCMADTLVPGGIYVIEGTHPRFFFPDEEENKWSVHEGDVEVELHFGGPYDSYNAIEQVWDTFTSITIREHGHVVAHNESLSKHRWYLKQEFDLFYRLNGMYDGIWFYGNGDTPPALLDDGDDSECMVVVLRKKL